MKTIDLEAPAPRGSTGRRAWRRVAAGSAIACLGVFLYLGRSAIAASVAALAHLQWGWVVLAVAAQAVSMVSAVAGHRRLLQAGGGRIRLRSVLAIGYASTAIASTVPFAPVPVAASYSFRQYAKRGIDLAVAAWALAISWIISTFALALVLFAGAATAGSVLAAAAGGVASLVFLVPPVALLLALRFPAVRDGVTGMTRRLVEVSRRHTGRPRRDVVGDLDALLTRTASLRLPVHQYVEVVTLYLGNWLLDIACLAFAIRATGAPVPWHGLLLVYGAGIAASSVVLTPGGLGVVEAAMAAALAAAGLPGVTALTAVLVYRLISFWLVLAVGWVVMAVMAGRTGIVSPRPAAVAEGLPERV